MQVGGRRRAAVRSIPAIKIKRMTLTHNYEFDNPLSRYPREASPWIKPEHHFGVKKSHSGAARPTEPLRQSQPLRWAGRERAFSFILFSRIVQKQPDSPEFVPGVNIGAKSVHKRGASRGYHHVKCCFGPSYPVVLWREQLRNVHFGNSI